MTVCVDKVGNTKLFYFISKCDHIHKICVKVFCCIRYRRNIVEMTLFQKYNVSYSETKRCLRVYIENIACRYYM